jgi:hypothetical protein
MRKLIECLQIFAKYQDLSYPTCCEHDVLIVVGIGRHVLSTEDKTRVEELGGFRWSSEYDAWASYVFGSA